MNEIIINNYYKLIKAKQKTIADIPAFVPQEVKDAVQALLDKDVVQNEPVAEN